MRGYSSSRSQRLCERLFVQKVPGGMRPLQWVLFSGGKYLGIWRLLLLRLECILKFIAHHIYLHNHTKIFLSKDRYNHATFIFDDFILDEKDSVNLFTVHFISHFDWLLYLTELWLVCLVWQRPATAVTSYTTNGCVTPRPSVDRGRWVFLLSH